MCILGTGDETVLNVAQMQVQSNSECNKYFKGRVKQNEMCTTSFFGGVGACEVSFSNLVQFFYPDLLKRLFCKKKKKRENISLHVYIFSW